MVKILSKVSVILIKQLRNKTILCQAYNKQILTTILNQSTKSIYRQPQCILQFMCIVLDKVVMGVIQSTRLWPGDTASSSLSVQLLF
jgi:hypothetical protein